MNAKGKSAIVVTVALLGALAAAALSACAGNDPEPAWSGQRIEIGSLFSTSGIGADYGPQQLKAARLAIEQVNGEDELNGAKLTLVQRDDASDPARSASAMKGLIEKDGVLAVLGPTFSNSAVEADPVANRLSTPVLAVSNTAPGIVGDCPYPCDVIFRDSLGEQTAIPANVGEAVSGTGGETAAIVHPADDPFGETTADLLGGAIPIAGCAGDQQAAAFGQGVLAPGDAKNTYGTGACLLCSTGDRAVESAQGLLATPACAVPVGGVAPRHYCLEGSVFVAGALVGWLRDGLGIVEQSRDIEQLARTVADSGGVMIVPALTGLGAPHWDPHARGTILGLSRATHRGHLARAALEAIALSVADVADCMQRDSGVALERLRVDGGASANDLLLQIQADVLGIPIERPAVTETTALGAALLAGLAVGFFGGAADVAAARRIDATFLPRLGPEARARLKAAWAEAVTRSRGWALAGQ